VNAPLRRTAFVLAIVAGLLAAPLAAWATEHDPGDDIPASAAIIGGDDAPSDEYPFMAGVLYHRDDPGPGDAFFDQFCGGSVVADRWVVTAAHCVTQAAPGGGGRATQLPIDVLVGTTSLAVGGQRIPVDQIVVYPDYLRDFVATPQGNPVSGQRHDIALLHLSASAAAAGVPFSDAQRPTPGAGTPAWAAGWGMTVAGDSSSYPYDLQHVDLELWSDDACAPFYPSNFDAAAMLCAYEDGPPGEPSHDTCSGDSGGPLVVESTGGWLLVGLTSFGISCGVAPGVYTEVQSYASWIHAFVDPPPPPPTTTTVTAPPVTQPPPPPTDRQSAQPGYWMLGSDCALYAFGSAQFLPLAGAAPHDCVAMAATPDGDGYWLLDRSGQVFAFGDAPALGHAPVGDTPAGGISSTATGNGYWVVDAEGNVFAFGDAVHRGGVGDIALNSPIISMTTAPDGSGYWLLAADGGVFTFGGARFWGSTGNIRLNKPVVAMAATATGNGYWLVASDGGVFAFGDAAFFGSMGGTVLNRPVNGLSRTPSGSGYWMVASDGGVFAFGDASFVGSLGNATLSAPVVGLEPSF
jgi:secreted trypsin-like serine protease